tara:strand:- start:98 stop:1177 length:1080 start_codon:yes stop_codon:yes gene_type:complete
MKVCIIGDGLVSLTLANMLAKKELSIDILSTKKNNNDKLRTLGISKSNMDYLNDEILDIKKISWNIKKIKVFTEKNSNKEILKFNNDNNSIFSIIKNFELQKLLNNELKKKKTVKVKNLKNYQDIIKQEYKLIINCNPNHQITKKFFSKKIKKNYNSYAYSTIINHKKVINNNIAFQNFTNNGPIAFLPISETATSVVYSLRDKNKKTNLDIKNLIKKYNPNYSITKIHNFNRFELISSHLRKYYKENILAFGDLLHKIHPLAGQGFNMSLRDIKLLSDLIDEKINLGLDLDKSICHEFQTKSQDKNYLFSTGIDCIYELFNFESKIKTNLLSRSINFIGKNKMMNSFFKKFADNGLRI